MQDNVVTPVGMLIYNQQTLLISTHFTSSFEIIKEIIIANQEISQEIPQCINSIHCGQTFIDPTYLKLSENGKVRRIQRRNTIGLLRSATFPTIFI